MPQDLGAGTPVLVTVTGVTTITTASARLIGMVFHGSATNAATLYSCKTTASATAASAVSALIVAHGTTGATANAALFVPFPAIMLNGITVDVDASADPNVTLFYAAA